MANCVSYNNLNLLVNLRIERPYFYIIQSPWILVLTITSKEKARYPHKFKLELDCSCLDSEKYGNSFISLNTKILIPLDKFEFIAQKYGINLDLTHDCLNRVQLAELLRAVEKYWKGGKRKLITVILNN